MSIELSDKETEQLEQLWTVTHETYLYSKEARDKLVTLGLARSIEGWNLLTEEGTLLIYKLRIQRRKEARKERT